MEPAKTYLDLATQDYRAVWWKLFRSVAAKELDKCPCSYRAALLSTRGKCRLERVLSQMKLIKTNRRICLSRDALDHLMCINAQGPLLSQFDAAAAVNRWWKAKQRRLGGKEMYSTAASASAAASASVSLNLDQWDVWVNE